MSIAELPPLPTPGRPAPPLPRATPAPDATGPLVAPQPAPAAPRRVTVVGDNGRADVALPALSTVAELVPVLARSLAGPGGPGLRLVRVGGDVLPGDRTVAALGLRDGELLHLVAADRPAATAIFDDLVDAVASNVSEAPGRWGPALSRRLAALVAAVAFGAAAVVAVAAAGWPAGPVAAGLLAAALLTAGVAVTRVRDDAAAGAALAGAGLPCLLALGPAPAAASPAVTAFAASAGYSLLCAVLLPAYRAWFAAAGGTAVAGAVAAAVVAGGRATPAGAAAVLMVLAVVAGPGFPVLALRLGRVPLPVVPTDMAAFRATEPPTPAPLVAGRAADAESALTALLTAEALIVVAGGAVLLRTPAVAGWILAAVAGLALLIRSRAYLGVAQRAALLGAGLTALGATAVVVARHGGPPAPQAVGALALLAGTACAVHAVRAGRRPPSPYWARFLDVMDFVAVTALIPAAAAVLGLYGSVRSLAG
ncbi:type VII secretion integral membrane protein EccD [Actinoplanes sp. NBRC 14428]|nr:type VII secretion integral membrane protein EccD [Actinoplanes sp. NBRC 14428]